MVVMVEVTAQLDAVRYRSPVLERTRVRTHWMGMESLVKSNIGSQRTLMWCRVREKVPVFKQQRRHMVGLKPDGFLMNYGSWQGPLQ
jgi:hypothetical protein